VARRRSSGFFLLQPRTPIHSTKDRG
jgi:hypothetical protein